MINKPEFDVFLAHNSQDKPQVKAIASELKRRGLKVWIDEEQILPGRPFQDVIQKAIPNVKSAAIFIGSRGLGKWQAMELRILISQCVDADLPVIPLLLPGAEGIPEDLLFLKQFNWLSFANNIDDVEVLEKLVLGITQQPPKSSPKTAGEFDVFLCYNDEDRSEVEQIAEQLKQRQIRPWLNVWEVPPGRSWQASLAAQIAQIHSVAIFIASKANPCQKEEIESFIWEFIELKRPVIPVILSNVLQDPELPIYLRSRTRVDFRQDKAEALYHLEWGITERKPENTPKTLEANDFSVDQTNYYIRLEELLAAKKWQEADQETKKLLLQSSGKKPNEKLGVEDIRNFSTEILCTIDELWMNYSNGRFGFSVQNKIWHQTRKKTLWQILKTNIFGNSDNDNNNEKDYWYIFGESVGWRKEIKKSQKAWVQYKDISFNINAPEGHLPCCREWWKRSYPEHEPKRFCALMLRIEKC
ncbi:MAG: TIR domain-containing protein [Microcoleus sp.]